MVNAVFIPPLMKRKKGQQPGNDANDIIRFSILKEGMVATVVKYDERSHQKSRGRNGKEECKPN